MSGIFSDALNLFIHRARQLTQMFASPRFILLLLSWCVFAHGIDLRTSVSHHTQCTFATPNSTGPAPLWHVSTVRTDQSPHDECSKLTVSQCIAKLKANSLGTFHTLLDLPKDSSPFLHTLSDVLDDQGPVQYDSVTVFAPNDAAFEKWYDRVHAEGGDALEKETIAALTAYHVLPSTVSSRDVPAEQGSSIGSQNLWILIVF